jgi:hypothetical protein
LPERWQRPSPPVPPPQQRADRFIHLGHFRLGYIHLGHTRLGCTQPMTTGTVYIDRTDNSKPVSPAMDASLLASHGQIPVQKHQSAKSARTGSRLTGSNRCSVPIYSINWC